MSISPKLGGQKGMKVFYMKFKNRDMWWYEDKGLEAFIVEETACATEQLAHSALRGNSSLGK